MVAKPDAKIFDDMAKMAGGAMNIFGGFREQMMNDIKARVEEMATRMDLVPREDFDILSARVAELEKKLAAEQKAPAPKSAAAPKKQPPKKTAGKKS